jgi:hypothetical protein
VSFNNPDVNSYRGAFSLDEVYNFEVNADFPDRAIFTIGNAGTYGWTVAGSFLSPAGGLRTVAERIDFANDSATASSRFTTTSPKAGSAGVNNAYYGWYVAGYQFIGVGPGVSYSSDINRIDFSNDTAATSLRSTLSGSVNGRVFGGTGSTNNYGWVMGGNGYPGYNPTTSIIRITFANDSSNASYRGSLLGGAYTGDVNNGIYAWVKNSFSFVERLTYATDTVSTVNRGAGITPAGFSAGISNSNYGWGGGSGTDINRIDFANDDIAPLVRGGKTTDAFSLAAVNNTLYGYWAGGRSPTVSITSVVSRLDFSNDSTNVLTRGPLTSARYSVGGVNNYLKSVVTNLLPNSDTQVGGYGWSGAGFAGPTVYSTVERIDFSNDSILPNIRTALPIAIFGHAAIGNAMYGRMIGGVSASAVPQSTVYRIDYANDNNSSTIRGPLTVARYALSAAGNANYGWFIGGTTGSLTSVIDRIDYSNDGAIANSRSVQDIARYSTSASSNANYGWFAGGYISPAIYRSNISRIDFSNDLTSPTSRGILTSAKANAGATGNVNYGWFGGGYTPTAITTVDRIDYSNDTATASIRGALSLARSAAATGNANYGWFIAGNSASTYYSTIDRINYANDAVTAGVRGTSNINKTGGSVASNYVKEYQQPLIGGNATGTYGWFSGGYYGASLSSVQRIDFANDTVAALRRGNLTVSRNHTKMAANASYGWTIGGNNFPTSWSSVERIDFNNDTSVTSTRGSLPIADYLGRAVGTDSFGWVAGGYDRPTNVNRIEYANDSINLLLRANLTGPRGGSGAAGNATYGWFAGGYNTTQPTYFTIDRITYSNDTIVESRGNNGRQVDNSSANSNPSYMWYTSAASAFSTVLRMDVANDLGSSITRGPLSFARFSTASAGNVNYGWFAGGSAPSIVNIVDRVDYANDTVAASARGPLAQSTSDAGGGSNYVKSLPRLNITQYSIFGANAGTGAGTYGWFVAGKLTTFSTITPVSTVDRIDYSNDGITAAVRTSLSAAKYGTASAATANYGWIGAGLNGTAPAIYYSLIERIDYSNDSIATRVRSPLNSAKWKPGGLNNNAYGWFVGGYFPPSLVSTVDRINFSNDTFVSNSSRAPLLAPRYILNGTGTQNYGWFVGGQAPAVGATSSIIRMDFSNDNTRIRGSTVIAVGTRSAQGVIGNAFFGWWCGGSSGGTTSTTIERLDFGNDSTTIVRSGLTQIGGYQVGVSSANYGWVGGGQTSAVGYSSVERIDLSNDTVSTTSRGPLSSARDSGVGVSNNTK